MTAKVQYFWGSDKMEHAVVQGGEIGLAQFTNVTRFTPGDMQDV